MKKGNYISPGLAITAVFLILAMSWFTVSAPFMLQQQQKQAKVNVQLPGLPAEEETPNPFSNSTDEKKESGSNTISEFLHDHISHLHDADFTLKHNKWLADNVYVAFHGELLSPPPEV